MNNNNERIIWSNLDVDYDLWEDDYKEWKEENEWVDKGLCEWVDETLVNYLYDERCNLHKEVDGVIVCLADVGLWNGRVEGFKQFDSNIASILYSKYDLCKWYCGRWNVRSVQEHHDGSNYLLYRVAESKEKAEWIEEMFIRGKMDMKKFMRHTKSLRPYVAKTYGF